MPTPQPDETEAEFIARCMGDGEANDSFPNPEQRLAVCHSLFQQSPAGQSAEHLIYHIAAQFSTQGVRHTSFLGRDFLVAPAVLVRSQVLNNSLGRTFLPPEEITQAWAQVWNGIPVLVGPHPSVMGQSASARDPDIWNIRGVGWLFNARAEDGPDGTRRLVAEVWLDLSRAERVVGFRAVLDQLAAGHLVELSTGFPVQSEEVRGSHNGEVFEMVLHPQGADHLVISTEMVGACAVEDGCGLGANQRRGRQVSTNCEKDTRPAGLSKILDRVVKLFSAPKQQFSWDDHEALRIGRELEASNQVSDDERRQKVQAALQTQLGGPDREVILTDTFSEEQEAVFWFSTPFGPQPPGPEFFRAKWTEGEGGMLHFNEPERVRRVTRYEPTGPAADNTVVVTEAVKQEQVQAVNTREEAMAGEQQNKQLEDLVAKLTEQVGVLTGKVTELSTQSAPAEVAGLKQAVAQLAAKFDKMEGVTRAAIDERERERQALVAKLAGNYRVPFTAAELETKPIEELRKLSAMAEVDNYAGRGGPLGGSGREVAFMEPVPYWNREDKTSKKEGR